MRFVLLILTSCLSAACASLLKGGKDTHSQDVFFTSSPSGARVLVNGVEIGETPMTHLLPKKNSLVSFEKEGYDSQTQYLRDEFDPLTLTNGFLFYFAPIGVGVDALTGAMWEFDKDQVHGYLRKGPTLAANDAAPAGNANPHPAADDAAIPDYPPSEPVARKYSGPRLGFTYLPKETRREIKRLTGNDVSSAITQFGYQFEKEVKFKDASFSLLLDLVPLLGGFDQNVIIPSITGIIGLRHSSGIEFGLGPNLAGSSKTAVAYTLGYSYSLAEANFPINLALLPNRKGTRISILTGINW